MANIVWSPFTTHLNFILFWACNMACGVLVPWPGIEPRPLEVKSWSPNHRTARESLQFNSYTCIYDGSIEMKNWGSETWCELLKIAEWDELKKISPLFVGWEAWRGSQCYSECCWPMAEGFKAFFPPFPFTPPPQRRARTGDWEGAPRGPEPPPWAPMWCLELLGLLSRSVIPWWHHSL